MLQQVVGLLGMKEPCYCVSASGFPPLSGCSTPISTRMVNLAAMVWCCLLEKSSMLVLVFGLWLVYILNSTLKQEESTVRDSNLLQAQDHNQSIPWKVQFNLGNSSQPSIQCQNSFQGKHLIMDDLGFVCERKNLLTNGCCDVKHPQHKAVLLQ
ncbi:UPF0454 protein C12orf49 [Sciurus carolinensis]|uniref:SREBP regulating gene protein n=1 Tax=Sciurus carolinensis TaxID=30640 RepID=A0AA41SX18_SCICA|nr:UPF0454 protein C12orf49 [Sciurus carolinensis]